MENSLNGGSGGGIAASEATIERCVIACNSNAWSGGGVRADPGSVFSGCTITSNSTSSTGGGVDCYGGTLARCVISRNEAIRFDDSDGGGVDISGAGRMVNCLVINNKARRNGGGVLCSGGGVVLHTTVCSNSAAEAGGVYNAGGAVSNSIVLFNAAPSSPNYHEESGGTIAYSCVVPSASPTCISNDPQFVASDDYRLMPGSPCVDAGMAGIAPGSDLEGTPRPLDGDNSGSALPDMGAYEHASRFVDSDGDRASDYAEYVAGTGITDSNDFFRVTSVTVGPDAQIGFRSSASRRYSLQTCTDLVDGVWSQITGQVSIPGTGGLVFLTDSNSFSRSYYRIQVQRR